MHSRLNETSTDAAATSGRRFLWLLLPAILAALALSWTARAPILRGLATLWIVSDPLKPADAIAVLGGGENLRPFVAADLYKQGLADKILVSNVKASAVERLGILPTHLDLNRAVLLKLGVPQEAIIGFGTDVSSTFGESRALADWAKNNGARTIIVPTEIFPSRRQGWILNHELAPVGARVMVDAIKPLDYGADDWWRHEEGLIDFHNEVIKYLYYRLKY